MLTQKNLRTYQVRAIKFALLKKCCALFLDMGLGKTAIVLFIIAVLKRKGLLTKPVLLIAPIRVMYSIWRQEAVKWEETRKLRFSLVHGSQAQRMAALNVPADVYLINPHGIVWLLKVFSNRRALDDWPFLALIVDESSAFKAPGTQRFKRLRHFLKLFKWRIILTGSPTPNHLLELWAQMQIVDLGERLGDAYHRFKSRFFEQTDHQGYAFAPRRGAKAYIENLIRDVAISMEASDWRTIPPITYNRVEVRLPENVRKMYDDFEEQMFIELAKGDVEAFNAASVSGRCHQIANGAIYTIDRESQQKIWEPVHDEKLKALEEILDEAGSPVLVAYHFKHDLERLRAYYPEAPVLSNPKTLNKIISEWKRQLHPVVLVHPASVGHGTDGLQYGGHTLAFFSMTHSYDNYDQLIKRIGGARAQRGTVVHNIIAKDTVDEAMWLSMQRKGGNQRSFLNALKQYQHMRQRAAAHTEASEFEAINREADEILEEEARHARKNKVRRLSAQDLSFLD